jgi:hypothetical protein
VSAKFFCPYCHWLIEGITRQPINNWTCPHCKLSVQIEDQDLDQKWDIKKVVAAVSDFERCLVCDELIIHQGQFCTNCECPLVKKALHDKKFDGFACLSKLSAGLSFVASFFPLFLSWPRIDLALLLAFQGIFFAFVGLTLDTTTNGLGYRGRWQGLFLSIFALLFGLFMAAPGLLIYLAYYSFPG